MKRKEITSCPVLIGSRALIERGVPINNARDVDVVCSEAFAKEIAWASTGKKGARLFIFPISGSVQKSDKNLEQEIILDVSVYEESSDGKQLLFDLTQDLADKDKLLTKVCFFDALVPPIEWL